MVPEPLGPGRKLVIGLGDHTLTLTLSALSLLYVFFLVEHAGLRPALATAIPLIGRFVDAATDPLMGRISDATRLWGERRRPYLLLGALPFGVSFTLLWLEVSFEAELAKFAYYTAAYILFSLLSTVVAVPYTALLPEMVEDYQERTSLNTYRAALNVGGTLLAAVAIPELVERFGGGASAWFRAACLIAVWLVLPWIAVYRVSFERPEFSARTPQVSLLRALKQLAAQRSYRQLSALYICGRIAMDISGMMLLFWLTHWLLRRDDFQWLMALVMGTAIASLPAWLWLSRSLDKRSVFMAGCALWLAIQPVVFAAQPHWPTWLIFAPAAFMGVGYAVVDMMPWSMLGEVIDEDELASGERREGLYSGSFTFIRKLGGALGVFLAGQILDWAGFVGGEPAPEAALWAVRGITSLGPALFLALAIAAAARYALSRARHGEILEALAERRRGL